MSAEIYTVEDLAKFVIGHNKIPVKVEVRNGGQIQETDIVGCATHFSTDRQMIALVLQVEIVIDSQTDTDESIQASLDGI